MSPVVSVFDTPGGVVYAATLRQIYPDDVDAVIAAVRIRERLDRSPAPTSHRASPVSIPSAAVVAAFRDALTGETQR